jgi:hypothetical protein
MINSDADFLLHDCASAFRLISQERDAVCSRKVFLPTTLSHSLWFTGRKARSGGCTRRKECAARDYGPAFSIVETMCIKSVSSSPECRCQDMSKVEP